MDFYLWRQLRLMGTRIALCLPAGRTGDSSAEDLLDRTEDLLRSYERIFSANDDSSGLMKINRAAGKHPVPVDSPQLYDLIRLGRFHSLLPGGNLNIAIGPVVKLWHIGFADARIPEDGAIRERLALTDPSLIICDDDKRTVFLEREGMEIDLGCLAKGYIGDLVADSLLSLGLRSALLDLGGNIITIGEKMTDSGSRPWRVGLQDPGRAEGVYERVIDLPGDSGKARNPREAGDPEKVRNIETPGKAWDSLQEPEEDASGGPVLNSVVTSGVYERKLVVGGKSYHHIIDPETGRPLETDMESITIRSRRSVDGEIWTSMLFGKSDRTIADVTRTINQAGGDVTCLVMRRPHGKLGPVVTRRFT